MGPPSIPRQRTGEEGHPSAHTQGLVGLWRRGPAGRTCLTNCAGTADALPGVELERNHLPDSWKVVLITHDRCDGGPRRRKAGFWWALFSSPWARTPRPLSF